MRPPEVNILEGNRGWLERVRSQEEGRWVLAIGVDTASVALRPMGHRLTLRYGWNRISADDSFGNGTDLEWQSHPNLLQRSEGASYW